MEANPLVDFSPSDPRLPTLLPSGRIAGAIPPGFSGRSMRQL